MLLLLNDHEGEVRKRALHDIRDGGSVVLLLLYAHVLKVVYLHVPELREGRFEYRLLAGEFHEDYGLARANLTDDLLHRGGGGEDEEGLMLLDNMEVSHRTGSNKGRHTCNV